MSNRVPVFDYKTAFSRNIGLLSAEEQEQLRNFTIAIPGMGGVGSIHLLSLVRQGFERFKIADFDVFELKNMNRQYGARMDTLHRPKAEVMREEALKINPECKITIFETGISDKNLDEFLQGVDLAVDGLDAFALTIRRRFMNEAHRRNIPSITAGPIGFSTAFLIFMPEGPSFDSYFNTTDRTSEYDLALHFFAGLTPSLLQMPYMKNTSLKKKQGPSSVGAVNLCAAAVTIQALKILLQKGRVRAVPYYHQYDCYRDKYVTRRLWFGNRNPVQKLKIAIARKLL